MSLFALYASSTSELAPIAESYGPSIPWVRIILAFLFCIMLAIAAIGFLRVRNGMPLLPDQLRKRSANFDSEPAREGERLKITQRLSVSPTSQLVVLKRGKQNYLLHLTAQGATEIDRFREGDSNEDEAGSRR